MMYKWRVGKATTEGAEKVIHETIWNLCMQTMKRRGKDIWLGYFTYQGRPQGTYMAREEAQLRRLASRGLAYRFEHSAGQGGRVNK